MRACDWGIDDTGYDRRARRSSALGGLAEGRWAASSSPRPARSPATVSSESGRNPGRASEIRPDTGQRHAAWRLSSGRCNPFLIRIPVSTTLVLPKFLPVAALRRAVATLRSSATQRSRSRITVLAALEDAEHEPRPAVGKHRHPAQLTVGCRGELASSKKRDGEGLGTTWSGVSITPVRLCVRRARQARPR